MSIKYTVNEEEFSALDESQQSLYSQGEGGYTLNVEGVPKEDVTGLKQKIDKLLGEKKTAQQKALEAEERAKAEAAEKLKKANDFEQLYNSSEAERQKTANELNDLKNTIQKQKLRSEASSIASGMTKDTARAKLLTEQIQSRLSLVDGEVRVLDANGNLTVSTINELTNSIKSEYPFLIDGSKSTGGGATGSSSGADDSKIVSRDEFEQMNAHKRMSFVKSGGKIR
jgi:vacuolar-type H+-ATPase subunit I/STV1|tara:strand:- start:167 stop:847 length:681 start_codon:yes stop_codon:yes gene_type:complete